MYRHKSPLRYPGGKAILTPLVANVIKQNNLFDGGYAEPYCGGAAIGLELLTGELVKRVYLNDADYRIYAFWSSMLNNTDDFIHLIKDTPLSIDEWRHQKDIIINYNDNDLLSVGFATFYLNRTNRSGILNAGPIGGYSQSGKWNLSARYNKNELINRILFLSNYSNRIKLSNYDALVFLDKLENNRSYNNKLLVYLDPPYYSMGSKLYLNYYTSKDHKQLAEYIGLSTLNWMLSYDNVKEIRDLYHDFPMLKMNLMYHAQTVKRGSELIVFNQKLNIHKTIH